MGSIFSDDPSAPRNVYDQILDKEDKQEARRVEDRGGLKALQPPDVEAQERQQAEPQQEVEAGSNAYDKLIDYENAARSARLKAMDRENASEPDSWAARMALAERHGVPTWVADRNYDELSESDRGSVYDQIIDRHDKLAEWMEDDPDNVVLSRDDHETLMRLEDVLRRPEDMTAAERARQEGILPWIGEALPAAFNVGQMQVELGKLRTKQMQLGELSPEEAERADYLSDQLNELESFGETGWWTETATSVATQLPIYGSIGLRGAEYGLSGAIAGAGTAAILGQLGPQAAAPEEIITVPVAAIAAGSAGFSSGAVLASYELEAGLAYDEYRRFETITGERIDDQTAKGFAAAAGFLNAGLEFAGLRALLRTIPGGDVLISGGSRQLMRQAMAIPTVRSAVRVAASRYAEGVATETATEFGQEMITTILGEMAKASDSGEYESVGMDEAMARSLESARMALQASSVLMMPGTVTTFAHESAKASRASDNIRIMEALGDTSRASKLRERMPEKFREAVAKMKEDGPIDTAYVDVDQWNKMFQSMDPEGGESMARNVAADVFGDEGKAYDEARRHGGDLRIPIERYTEKLAGTDLHSELMRDVRFDPDSMSMREAEAWQSRWQDRARELQEQAQQQDVHQRAFHEIRDDLMGQLMATGMDRSSAEASATLPASAIVAQARREGMDPYDLYGSRPISVTRPMPEILQTPGGTFDTTIDPLLDRLREGDIPSQADAFGPSLSDFLRDMGGVRDEGGELAAAGVDEQLAPFQRRMAREDGVDLDEAAGRAAEAGYLPGMDYQTATPNALLEAIRSEAAGQPVYAVGAESPALASEMQALDELDSYLQDLGLDPQTMDNETIKQAIIDQDPATPAPDEFSYSQFAGEMAETANKRNLQRAEEMIEDGADPERVRKETGWFKGDDGKWRYEISDDQATINVDAFSPYGDTGVYVARLGELLDHPELFAAYPELGGLEVTTSFVEGGSFYSPAMDMVSLSNELHNLVADYHTGNYRAAVEGLVRTAEQIEQDVVSQARQLFDEVRSEEGERGIAKLEEQLGTFDELVAENLERALELNDKRKAKLDGEVARADAGRALMDTVLHEVQHAIQTREGFAAGGSPESMGGVADADRLYRRLAGEVEARNVEARRAMTADDRVAISPDETADTRPREYIIHMDGRDIVSASIPANTQVGDLSEVSAAPDDPNVLYQSAETPNLIAIHNLSEDNLLFADQMGGLAVPSIGIVTDQAGGVEEFGDITMIGRQSLGDPESGSNVWSADAWTARYPKPEYNAPKVDDVRELSAVFSESAQRHGSSDFFLDTTEDAQGIIDNMINDSVVMDHYLRNEQGVEVDPVFRGSREWREWGEFVEHPMMERWVNDPDLIEQALYDRGGELWLELEADIIAADESIMSRLEVEHGIDEGEIPRINTSSGMSFSAMDRFIRAAREGSESLEYDYFESKAKYREAIEPYGAEFKKWVEDLALPMFGEPFIRIGRKKEPYTIDNVVRYLTSRRRQEGSEESMVFGTGKATALASERLTSVTRMKERAGKSIADKDVVSEAREETEAKLDAYREAVIGSYSIKSPVTGGVDVFSALDDSMKALSNFIQRKRRTPAALRKELEKEYFEASEVSDEAIRLGIEAAEAMDSTPVPYFEARPQRAVPLDEFAGALVPSDVRPQTIELLESYGIKVRTFDPEGDRAVQVRSFARELDDQMGNVLFQSTDDPAVPQTITVDGVERPTVDASGKRIHETTDGLIEFWRWFGDSQTVDEHGRPVVYYHGRHNLTGKTTLPEGIDEFAAGRGREGTIGGAERSGGSIHADGIWFASQQEANEYALADEVEPGVVVDESSVYPVYLRVESPEQMGWADARYETVDAVLERGNDSVHVLENGNIVVFDPAQVKSAVGNVGTFSPDDPRILHQDDTADREGRRGAIKFGPQGKYREFRVELYEGANLSTFLHESGHYFLEMLADLAERADATEGVKSDFQDVLDYLGVKDRSEIGVEQHEKWARSFEAYLREGKAPSPELESAFAKFRAWLVWLYKSLLQLDVKLTDDVRGVMDRLLAGDDAVQTAAGEMQAFESLFESPEQAGWDQAAWDRYHEKLREARVEAEDQIAGRIMREQARERKKWWKEAAERVRAEVTEEVDAQPGYRALVHLQSGQFAEGESMKLSRQALVDMYGEPILKRLPGPGNPDHRGVYIYTRKEDGVDPEVVASMFGFRSGDHLVQSLINLRDRKELIEEETNQRMKEDYGDMLMDGSIADEAMYAVHNSKRGEVLQLELKALNRKRGASGAAPGRMIKFAAKRQITDMKVMDIRPDVYRRAEAKAGRDAFDAAVRGDFEAAYQAKQKQLYNHHLYREARNAKERSDKIRDHVSKFRNRTRRERLSRAGPEYLDQVDGIMADYEFVRIPKTAIRRRQSLRDFLASKMDEEQIIEEPEYAARGIADRALDVSEAAYDTRDPDIASLVTEAETTNWQELTISELEGVRDNLDMIWHVATLKDRLLADAEKRRLDDVADELASSIKEHATREVKQAIQSEIGWNSKKDKIAEYLAESRRLPSFAREMDGGQDGGAAWRTLIKPLNIASSKHTAMIQAHSEAFAGLMNKHYSRAEQKQFLKNPREYESINESLTKDGVLAIALNWGNAINRDRLMMGEGWTERQVEAVLDTLDKRDWQFVQGVWDYLSTYQSEFFENHRKMFGIAPKAVEATPVQTKFGEFRGGYYPIKFDPHRSKRTSDRAIKQEAKRYATPTQRDRASASHERLAAGTVRLPIRLTVTGVVNQHVSEVAQHIAFDQPLMDVARILARPQVQDAIITHYGRQVYNRFNRLLIDMKFGTKPADNVAEDWLVKARNNMSVAAMAYSATVTFLQPLGMTNSIVQVGPGWMLKGLARVGRDSAQMENSAAWVMERSEFMRYRRLSPNREIGDVMNRMRKQGWRSKMDAAAFWTIANVQFGAVDLPTWYGAYEKALAAGVEESEAVFMADQAVRDAQGGGDLIDQTEFQRGGPVMKLFTNFMSYMATTWSIQAERYRATDFRDPMQVAKFAANHLILMAGPAAGAMILDSLAGTDDPFDDDPAVAFLQELASMYMGGFVGIRELASAFRGYSYQGPAGLSAFKFASDAIQQTMQGEMDEQFVRSYLRLGGVLFGFPAYQIDRSLFGTKAYIEGETDDPRAILFGPPID